MKRSIVSGVYEYAVQGTLLRRAQVKGLPLDDIRDAEHESHMHEWLTIAIQVLLVTVEHC